MYTLTPADRAPRNLFGKTYCWSADDNGRLHLVSLERLTKTLRNLNEALKASDD